MNKLNPYLNFNGTCEVAFNFYKSVFGGEFLGGIYKMKDAQGMPVPDEAKELVMHVGLPIGNDILMGSDTFPGRPFTVGNNNYISIFPESRTEADRLFSALSADGTIEVPLQEQFWGDYYGSFTDKFGVCWMINYNEENIQK